MYKHIKTIKEHKGSIYTICSGPSDEKVFTAGSDRHVVLWDLKELKAEKVVAKSPTTIISLEYINALNLLLIGQVEGGVHIIDLNQGKEIRYLKLHQGYIFDIIYIEEKEELVLSSGDGSISIWSVPDFNLLYHKKISDKKIRKMDYAKSRGEIACALGNGGVAILDTEDWHLKKEIQIGKSAINVVRYLGSGNEILVGEKDAHLYLYHIDEEEVLEDLAAHYWAIYDIQLYPEGNNTLFATASRDKTIKIWDANEMKVLKRFEGLKDQAHTHSVNALLWSNYNNYLLSAGDDYALKVWQISNP